MLSALSWVFPGWVGDYGENPYKNVSKLAYYTLKWIKGAKEVHDLNIDFIGVSDNSALRQFYFYLRFTCRYGTKETGTITIYS